jgi:hypothetical protein
MPSEKDLELEVEEDEIEEDLVLVGAIVGFFEAGYVLKLVLGVG